MKSGRKYGKSCEEGIWHGVWQKEEVRKTVKSMGAEDLMRLTIKEDESGWAIYLDNKKLHHVENFRIESATLPGAAELSIKVLVKYP